MRRSIYIISLLLLNFLLFSKSIFVYLNNSEKSTFFVEEGIIDCFFEAGHIVFNAEQKEGIGGRSLILAKNGGADILIEIEIVYSAGEEKDALPLSVSAEFRVIDIVKDSTTVGDGRVSMDLITAGKKSDIEKFYFNFGKSIAKKIMERGFIG